MPSETVNRFGGKAQRPDFLPAGLRDGTSHVFFIFCKEADAWASGPGGAGCGKGTTILPHRNRAQQVSKKPDHHRRPTRNQTVLAAVAGATTDSRPEV